MSRVCDRNEETILYVLSKCNKLAQPDYRKQHSKVAQNVYWSCYMQKKRVNYVAGKVAENQEAMCDRILIYIVSL